MNFKSIISFFTIIICTLFFFFSCTKDKTPRPATDIGEGAVTPVTTITVTCDPNKVYFEQSIKPIINSNCAMSGCHDAGTKQDGVDLSTYDGIRAQVRPGRPEDSEIIEMINETDPDKRMPPLPKPPLTQEQKNLIWTWIQQGADNSPVCTPTIITTGGGTVSTGSGCNPANVLFATTIKPILSANCIGCHSGNTISGGVDLATHAGVQVVAQNGKLVHAVAQDGQATPMPQGGKLQACDIQKIKVWVEEGYKNN
jgi:uncharacterized membrane protein